jgi:hypothetical protein
MKIFEISFPDGTNTIIFADGYRDARRRCYDKWPNESVDICRVDIV